MSLARPLVNTALRLFERPYLARVQEPAALRRVFDLKARLMFRAPRGTRSEWQQIGGVRCLRVFPKTPRPGPNIVHFHGGAYVFGSPVSHRGLAGQLAALTGREVILPDYRLAPEHPFPAAAEDALAFWQALAPQGPHILGGDSAGGGLAMALAAQLRGAGLPMPQCSYLMSPFLDMTYSGASISRNARAEAVLPAERMDELADMYLQGGDSRDPRASPLFAELADLAPLGRVIVMVSDAEILEDDGRRMASRLAEAGAAPELIEGHGLPHVWPFFHPVLPEARASLRDLAGRLTG